jgi:hypothetical protein
MNTSRTLKIWTLITFGVIVVGWGHGILFFFLVEFFGYAGHLSIVAAAILLGQLSIVLSIVKKEARFKVIGHIIGLFFLWAGILYFVYSARDRHYVFITFSVLPFVVCTILTFAGRYIKRLY